MNPLDSTNLYLATSQGLFRTTDGGAHWLPDNEGLPIIRAEGFEYVGEVRDVIIDPLNPARLYALLPSKPQATELAFVSDDAGSSWRAIDFGGDIRVTALAVDPRDSARVYAGTFEQPDSDGFAFSDGQSESLAFAEHGRSLCRSFGRHGQWRSADRFCAVRTAQQPDRIGSTSQPSQFSDRHAADRHGQ